MKKDVINSFGCMLFQKVVQQRMEKKHFHSLSFFHYEEMFVFGLYQPFFAKKYKTAKIAVKTKRTAVVTPKPMDVVIL